jgi:hypothetical protein
MCEHCAMYVDATSGESYTCARPIGQRGLRTPAFGADTATVREEPVRHVVRGLDGSPGPRPARPAVNIHSFIHSMLNSLVGWPRGSRPRQAPHAIACLYIF